MWRGYPIGAGIRAHGAGIRGYLARMLFFSSGLGCFGSIVLSVILTLALLFVLRVI
jgi:hypothetical protein